jgi:hypothetical protein
VLVTGDAIVAIERMIVDGQPAGRTYPHLLELLPEATS